MPKKSIVKYNRLTDEIDNRLLAHVKKIEQDNKSVVITSSVVSEYVRNADYRFRRMKKMQLEKSIDRGTRISDRNGLACSRSIT